MYAPIECFLDCFVNKMFQLQRRHPFVIFFDLVDKMNILQFDLDAEVIFR